MQLPLRIGTRKSPLALAQCEEAKRRLMAACPALSSDECFEIVPIVTSGDKVTDRLLADIGGKGLFTKEIEEALLAHRIDVAVHSLKDMETWLPAGLTIGAVLPREDPRDVLITRENHPTIEGLPHGAVFASASGRRAAQVKHLRPDIRIIPLRGNVATRITKIHEGVADATMLALAGLKRLGIAESTGVVLSTETVLPACGQGTVALQCRAEDAVLVAALGMIDDLPTRLAITAERAMLAVLDGSCRTPIGGYAEFTGSMLTLRGLLALPDGSLCYRATRSTDVHSIAEAAALGEEVAADLLAQGGKAVLNACR